MNEMAAFFEPSYLDIWAIKMLCQIGAAFVVIWVIACILSRIHWSDKGSAILNVYFGWLIPITLYALVGTFFLIASTMYYKEMGISLWFSTAYLFLVLGSGAVGINLSLKIKTIMDKKQLNAKGGEK